MIDLLLYYLFKNLFKQFCYVHAQPNTTKYQIEININKTLSLHNKYLLIKPKVCIYMTYLTLSLYKTIM